MISIQVYLIARVCFRRNAQFLTSTSKIKIVVNNNRRKNISCESGSVENWRKITIIMLLLCNSVLFTLALRSFNTLILLIFDGDVESNPGSTYVIVKAIRGSHHQGDR